MTAPAPPPPTNPNVNLAIGAENAARLQDNIVHFARLLRKIGFSAGGDRCAIAAQALALCGVSNRRDVCWTLAAVFVHDPAQLPIYHQAFALFWRSARAQIEAASAEQAAAAGEQTMRRLAEQLSDAKRRVKARLTADASGTASDNDALHRKDFEQMTDAEWRAAMRCIRALPAALPPLATRRRKPAPNGSIDLRRSCRAARTTGGEVARLMTSKRLERQPPIVILADISASMAAYARMLTHLIAALSAAPHQPVHAFLFGTTLTPLRRLKNRDADATVAAIAASTRDWHGGTRIGAALAMFNRQWSRRVLSGGATVLLATDGLERGDLPQLQREAMRLQKSCRHLIWLNPLLRYPAYEPLAGGARILTRAATQTRPIHNITTLSELMAVISQP